MLFHRISTFFSPGRGTRRGRARSLALLCLFLCALPGAARADGGEGAPDGGAVAGDFLATELEDLMNVQVTSVSRKSQRLSDAAAAVFVISQDDIRRSGVTTIAEALRMAPGLEVARIDSNKWAISSRGFNGRFASKMLVLFDGRTVYTPLFSGVFWDRQDTLLEDIDRIEVIRGPGATMWGANAVNGVINIITKDAAETLGGVASAGAGTLERGFGSLRYGLQLGESTSLRAYGKYTDRDGFEELGGEDGHNGWRALRGGIRLDSQLNPRDTVTLQGDLYRERLDETYFVADGSTVDSTSPIFGANLLSRWTRQLSDTAELSLQLYYDRTEAAYPVIDETRDTVDLDFQNRFAVGSRHEILWGAGYRMTRDRIKNVSSVLVLTPTRQTDHLLSAFVQDDITLLPDRLHLIIGSKFERNSYTGFEVQPSVRGIWTPNQHHTVWGAVSRAVRTPSRIDTTFSLITPLPGPPQNPPVMAHLMGSEEMKAEELLAYELGYRVEPNAHFGVDLALFYNFYRRLAVTVPGEPVLEFTPPTPHLMVPMPLASLGRAQTVGAELSADARPLPYWRTRLAYTFLQLVHKESGSGVFPENLRHENPHHQVSLRSSLDLPRNVQLDLWLRFVDELPALAIDSYLTLDARLAWQPRRGVELALVGQNLLDDQHQEFQPQFIGTKPARAARGVYGTATWHF